MGTTRLLCWLADHQTEYAHPNDEGCSCASISGRLTGTKPIFFTLSLTRKHLSSIVHVVPKQTPVERCGGMNLIHFDEPVSARFVRFPSKNN